MEKVKITQEQANQLSKNVVKANGVRRHIENKWMSDLTTDELIRALYIGYEVEPNFKVGDWVVCESNNYKGITKITRMDELRGKPACYGHWFDIKANTAYSNTEWTNFAEECRHATPEEIAEEKERRWWAKHDRDVWEIREGDALIYIGVPYIVDWFNSEEVRFKSGKCNSGFMENVDYVKEYFKVFCFVEDRKDA